MTLPLLVCAVLVGGGLFFAAWSLVVVRDRAPSNGTAVLGRIERYATPSRVPSDPRERHSAWRNLIGSLRRALSARERPRGEVGDVRDQLNDRLRKAGIPLRAIEWRVAWVLAGVLVLGGVGLRLHPLAGLAAGLGVALGGGRIVLEYRLRRWTRQFEAQLGDVILLLASAVRSGCAFSQALMTVSATAQPPVGPEFGRASREMELGVPLDGALRRLVERNPSEDLDLLATAVQIHRIVGGNLSEILESIAATIRDRIRIKADIRTLTAQARASGWIVSLLPVALVGVLSLIAPDYFTPMFRQPAGLLLLAAGAVSMGCGILIIRRIVAIRV